MQAAQVLAGFSLGQADILRRAMGKKDVAEMEKQREIFVEGCDKNDIKKVTAEKIFDLIEKFAGYGFNKSHSAAYALLSYQTAYLKTYFPEHFMAAVLSTELGNTDKIYALTEECKKLGITIISILDTNCDPNMVDIPIPANDDAVRSIKLIISVLADAIKTGKQSTY